MTLWSVTRDGVDTEYLDPGGLRTASLGIYIQGLLEFTKQISNVLRYLVLLNSSINFIIYCFVGSKFRITLRNHIFKVVSPDSADNDSVKHDQEEVEMTFNNNDNSNNFELREEESRDLMEDTILVVNS